MTTQESNEHYIILYSIAQIIKQRNTYTTSDDTNHEEQYKNRKTFYMMKLLAKRHNIKIYWYYGVAGHGWGLVDAMSSFGVKQPLKHEIITNDNWFPTANGMVLFLKDCFET